MKKTLLLMGLGLASISFAHAENRLFPTDILSKGEVDARITFDHQNYSENMRGNGFQGISSLDYTFETIQVRYGLGANWHVGASLNDAPKYENQTAYSNPPKNYVSTSSEGRQNPSIWLKYGVFDDKSSPLSLSGQMTISPNTTGKASSYSGEISAGWKSSDTLKLFANLVTTTSRNQDARNTDSIEIGAYENITENITLIPHLRVRRLQGTNLVTPMTRFEIGLSSDIQISKGTYLIPDISRYRNNSWDSKDGVFHYEPMTNGHDVSLALYHLFK